MARYNKEFVDKKIGDIIDHIVDGNDIEFSPNAWNEDDLVVNMYCLIIEDKPGCDDILEHVCSTCCAGQILERMIKAALKHIRRNPSEYSEIIERILEVSEIEAQ